MSDFYSETRSANRAGLSVFIVDDVGSNSIDRVKALLAGIPHGADKAIGSAIKRAGQSGEAYAARAIREHYVIKAGDFKSYTKSKRKIVSDSMGTSVEICFTGRHIPLMKFDTKVDSSGRVSARVKRTSARTTLDHVFAQSVGSHGHTGVFERRTSKRLPIEEKFGPSTPQMMEANDDISQEIGDKVRDVFEERLNHEMLAVLNGWRK
ncbi:MAG: hypothetical protein ACI4RU_07925 [Acutalibacteraceae bacterium]